GGGDGAAAGALVPARLGLEPAGDGGGLQVADAPGPLQVDEALQERPVELVGGPRGLPGRPSEERLAQGGGGGGRGPGRGADGLQGHQLVEALAGGRFVVPAVGQFDVLAPEAGDPPPVGRAEVRLTWTSHQQTPFSNQPR